MERPACTMRLIFVLQRGQGVAFAVVDRKAMLEFAKLAVGARVIAQG